MGKYILMLLVFFIGLFIICSFVGLIMAVPALATFIYQRFFEEDDEDDK